MPQQPAEGHPTPPPPEWAGGPAAFEADPRIRAYPGTYVRDWIILCRELPDAAFRAYCAIRAHIWEKDEHRNVTVTQEEIGQMLDKSTDRVRKIIKPLLDMQLIRVAGKKEWYVYNHATKRNERRAMNIYAVTDFPADGYEGPRSLADFRRRFLEPDRSKTTGRQAAGETAGHTDRSKTTGESSSQVTGITAGQADRSKTTSGAVENDPPSKNLSKNGGGEGDARARVSESAPVQWAVQGRRRTAPPSLEANDVVVALAEKILPEGAGLTANELDELAAAVDAVRPVVEDRPGLSWAEYRAWLEQGWYTPDGRPLYTSFFELLRWRLRPEQVQYKAWPWACAERGAREASEARGGRPAPAAPELPKCGRHGTQLVDGRCLPCDSEQAERDALERARQEAPPEEDLEEDPADLEPVDEETVARMIADLYPSKEEAARRKEEALEEYRRKAAERAATK